MLKKKLKGSTTVEAAFVMPIIIFCIFAMLYLGFDLHDQVCITSILDQMGREGVQAVSSISAEELEKKIETKVNKKLCITNISNISVNDGFLMLRINYTVTKKISFMNLEDLFNLATHKKSIQVKKYNPMKAVRSLGGVVLNESGI